MKKRACQHCRNFFPPLRNPNQYFCNQPLCQKVRKAEWRRTKLGQDPDYQENYHDTRQKWQKENPDYWKDYRATHPSYADRNREKQIERNTKSVREPLSEDASPTANSDALTGEYSINTWTCQLPPISQTMIAKCDELIVKIPVVAGSCEQTGRWIANATR